jgi:hypothetical protein
MSVLVAFVVQALARRLFNWLKRGRLQAESHWRRHVDLSVVQACLLTTEHLQSLGRIEKRTLFVKPITEVFRNEYILARVLSAAEKIAESGEDPVLSTHLTTEDKWHVLNTCTNHVSACFAPYHVFFNQARHVESYYKSAWYCFTLTCAQTSASGRWFITPRKPVEKDDIGMLRIRIVMMNEQELRDIASGSIEPPSFGFFNGRHESRWRLCSRFAELFQRQVSAVTGSEDIHADWGPNLCGRISRNKRPASSDRVASMAQPSSHHPEDNSILRIHVPFPGSRETTQAPITNDVVLYE